MIQRALTGELSIKDSPVRQFFDDRFSPGLRDVQARYRIGAGPLVVPGVPQSEANPGTIGTAADWLMRFLVCPTPTLQLAAQGASLCGMLPARTNEQPEQHRHRDPQPNQPVVSLHLEPLRDVTPRRPV